MTTNNNNIFEILKAQLYQAPLPEKLKADMMRNLMKLKNQKVNIMITGATGVGKSSTINALFNAEKAKVGIGVDPETMTITRYELDNLILWDTPGLGDGKEADMCHAKNIVKKLHECDSDGKALIDLVLVILDGSSRDLGTSYELINSVIIPNLGPNKEQRILVTINQCDVAMKGRYWNYEENRPEPQLEAFLDEKVQSVRRRIREGTGVDIEPIYYSAGWQDGNEKQNPYNLTKLLYYIIEHTPEEKRLVYAQNMSEKTEVWKTNDNLKNYSAEVKSRFTETLRHGIVAGAATGATIGTFFGGPVGAAVGGAIGGIVGGMVGAIGNFLSKIF